MAIIALSIAAVPSAAQGQQFEHVSFVTDFGFDNSCEGGPTVTGRYQDHGTLTATQRARDGLVRYTVTTHGTETFTNVATGKSLVLRTDITTRDVHVTDNGDGTLTLLWQSSGAARVTTSDGRVIAVSAGRTVYEALLDSGGTPQDPSDDELIRETQVLATGRDTLSSRDYCADVVDFTT